MIRVKLGKLSRSKKKQQGQALIEFILLLSVLVGISFGFTQFMNKNVSRYWEYCANLIIDDKPGTKTVQLR